MFKKKIYIYYDITSNPWGGGNSFLKALRKYIVNHKYRDYKFASKISGNYDFFFINGGHKAPGKYIDIDEIKKIKYKKRLLHKNPIIIYRLDGARFRYNKDISEMDSLQYEAVELSDHIIFQSRECLESFREMGYSKDNYDIIHNGVDQGIFNVEGKSFWDGKRDLKIFSCNWSSNIHKGYEVIAEFSKNKHVQCHFTGNWNETITDHNVIIRSPVMQAMLADHYRDCDVFLHGAENDPCPNVILEALSCGLPVIYHDSGGAPDIAKEYGIALPADITSSSIEDTINDVKMNYHKLVEKIIAHRERFSIQCAAEKYLNVFNRFV